MKQTILAVCLALSMATYCGAQTPGPAQKCAGMTQKGTHCTRNAKNGQYCAQHDPKSAKCGVATQSGKPCSRTVKAAGQHCKQHSK